MKTTSILSAILFALFISGSTSAAPDACQQAFKADVASCTELSEPGLSLAACLHDARDAKKACKGGDNGQCVTECESNHTSAVTQCNSTWDTAQCYGNPICIINYTETLTICIESADFELNACLSDCSN